MLFYFLFFFQTENARLGSLSLMSGGGFDYKAESCKRQRTFEERKDLLTYQLSSILCIGEAKQLRLENGKLMLEKLWEYLAEEESAGAEIETS